MEGEEGEMEVLGSKRSIKKKKVQKVVEGGLKWQIRAFFLVSYSLLRYLARISSGTTYSIFKSNSRGGKGRHSTVIKVHDRESAIESLHVLADMTVLSLLLLPDRVVRRWELNALPEVVTQ